MDGGAQVVDVQGLRHAAELAEGIFQAADEVLGGLSLHRFGVALAGVREDHAQQMHPAAFARGILQIVPRREVDLRLFTRQARHPPDAVRFPSLQDSAKPFDRIVGAGKAQFVAQVLVDALGGKSRFQFRGDQLAVRLTLAAAPGLPGVLP